MTAKLLTSSGPMAMLHSMHRQVSGLRREVLDSEVTK